MTKQEIEELMEMLSSAMSTLSEAQIGVQPDSADHCIALSLMDDASDIINEVNDRLAEEWEVSSDEQG